MNKMSLAELKKGESAVISSINADSELRNRLHSFGIAPGERVEVKECSLAKKTMNIEVEGTQIALREEEAEKINIKKL